MKPAAGTLLIVALYVLHQDFWLWRQARPLIFGFMPIGLFYHAAFTLVTAVAMAVLVRLLWPSSLDPDALNAGGAPSAGGAAHTRRGDPPAR